MSSFERRLAKLEFELEPIRNLWIAKATGPNLFHVSKPRQEGALIMSEPELAELTGTVVLVRRSKNWGMFPALPGQA